MTSTARHGVSASMRWFRISLWLHRWTGLAAAPLFFVLCLTGSVLIFHEEVDQLLGDRPATAGDSPTRPVSIDALAASALNGAPDKRILFVMFDADAPDSALFSVGLPGTTQLNQGKLTLISRSTGQSLAFTDPAKTFTGVLLKLHAQWFMGVPGQIFGGGIALLVLTCLISGVVVYAPFGRRLAFGTVRPHRGARILQLDLHNHLGLVLLGWATVVTASGIMLAAGAILVPFWQATELREMAGGNPSPPSRLVSADVAAAAAEQRMPDRRLRFLFYPGTEFSSQRHYTAGMAGTRRYNERVFDVVLIDAGSGEVAAARSLPLYLQSVLISEPLHFGDYGGLALKLFWIANAWMVMFITANGAWLWWKQGRRPFAKMPA